MAVKQTIGTAGSVEFVYFLRRACFLGNCRAALIFCYFFIKKKVREL